MKLINKLYSKLIHYKIRNFITYILQYKSVYRILSIDAKYCKANFKTIKIDAYASCRDNEFRIGPLSISRVDEIPKEYAKLGDDEKARLHMYTSLDNVSYRRISGNLSSFYSFVEVLAPVHLWTYGAKYNFMSTILRNSK